MPYIVWPADGLRSVTGNPRSDPGVHRALINGRRLELEQLRDDILTAIANRISDRLRASQAIGVYQGAGVLLIDEEVIKIPWLEDYRARPLKVALDGPLPEWQTLTANNRAAAAQPWHLGMIKPPAGLNGATIKIGVIDTGFDPAFPDLAAPGFAPTSANYQPGPQPSMVPGPAANNDVHGSVVSAFLAGQISGVAKGATLFVAALPVKTVLSNQSMLVVALNWLNSIGCDIITTSMFSGAPTELPSATVPSAPTGPSLDGVEYVLSQTHGVFKTFITAAIGNTGNLGDFQHPGVSVHATGVGAVNKAGKWFGSAYGPIAPGVHKPDLVAPGYQLQMPTSPTSHAVYGGTSFAAPIVAGAVALILQKHPSLKGQPSAIAAKLATLVKAVPGGPPANSTGAGRLDLSTL